MDSGSATRMKGGIGDPFWNTGNCYRTLWRPLGREFDDSGASVLTSETQSVDGVAYGTANGHLDPFYSGSWDTIPTLERTHMPPFPRGPLAFTTIVGNSNPVVHQTPVLFVRLSLLSGFYIPPMTTAASLPPIEPWGLFFPPSLLLKVRSHPPFGHA